MRRLTFYKIKSGHILIGWCFAWAALFGCMAIEPVGTLALFTGIYVGSTIRRPNE